MTEANLAFGGYVSHASLGEEAVQGVITFVLWRLRFTSEAATLEMPLARLVIEKDSAGDGRICFSDPEQPEWSVFTFDKTILERGPLLQQPHTQHQIRDLHSGRELNRRLKVTFAFIVVFALGALLVSMLTGLMVRALVARVPVQWERDLGEGLMTELKENEVFIQDAKLKAQLDRAVAPLLPVLPKNGPELKFYIIESPVPNAFALPGGHVVVNNSLLKLCDRPEELAGVVAHELAHVTQKHGFRKIISEAGPYLIVKIFLGGERNTVGMLGASSQLLVRQSFSQEYELEADDVGWKYMVAARVDPRGMVAMLKKLKAEQDKMSFGNAGLGAFSSHPATEKRIRRLEAKWAKLKEKSGFLDYDQVEPRPGAS